MVNKKYNTEEEVKAARREARVRYKANHQDKVKESRTTWVANNPNYLRDYRSTLFGMCSNKSAKYRAKDRRKFGTDEGSITAQQMKEMIEAQPHCFYCGCEDIMQLGLDRIDNSKPHTVENCVVACWNCNNERRTKDFEEYKNIKLKNAIKV